MTCPTCGGDGSFLAIDKTDPAALKVGRLACWRCKGTREDPRPPEIVAAARLASLAPRPRGALAVR